MINPELPLKCASNAYYVGSYCAPCKASTFATGPPQYGCAGKKNPLTIHFNVHVGCPSTCATCDSGILCQTCVANSYLSLGTCIPCERGTFTQSPTSASCTSKNLNQPFQANLNLACPFACTSCTSATSCQSCRIGLFQYKDQCLTYCPDGTYGSAGSCFGIDFP